MASLFNYDTDFPSLPLRPIRPISKSICSIFIKMMSGEIIPIEIVSKITIKEFYELVWRTIPNRIALQCIDLFREDSEDPLLPILTPLHPKKNEIFNMLIQIHPHLSLSVAFEANAYYQDKLYESYEVLVYSCFPEELTYNPSYKRQMYDGMYYHPTDQEGRPIPHGPRYKMHLYRFFSHDQIIDNKIVTSFYSQKGINFVGQDDDDDDDGNERWNIEIEENTQPLKRLADLFIRLSIPDKEKSILGQALEDEWYEIISM